MTFCSPHQQAWLAHNLTLKGKAEESLTRLYGVVSVIDPHFFGDLASFKAWYARQQLDPVDLALLRTRLSKVCNRSLRRQLQENRLATESKVASLFTVRWRLDTAREEAAL